MKIKSITAKLFYLFNLILLTVVPMRSAIAESPLPLPKGVPPVIGTMSVGNVGSGEADSEWTIRLSLPKVSWRVVGKVIPKSEYPELEVAVEVQTLDLRMGGPSALSPSRIVDLEGKELARDQILKRLKEMTPVMVSVSGKIPDAYYLQLSKPESLIVILGPRDGSPAPKFLPSKKLSPKAAKREAKPRMKGTWLYSWRGDDGVWLFALVEGKNVGWSTEAVKGSKNHFRGVDDLTKALSELAKGEQVSWFHLTKGFEFPPKTVQAEILSAAESSGLTLDISE